MSAIHYECRPEECLLTNLNFAGALAQHHNGSGTICELLSKEKELIGWIDEDPTANHHPYYKRMCRKVISDKYGLKYCYDPATGNKLIIVKPKMEDWIIGIAKKYKVNLEDYDLSNDPNELHKIINFKINKFQEVLHKLLRLKAKELLHAQAIILDKRK